jgi:hypothetical protein
MLKMDWDLHLDYYHHYPLTRQSLQYHHYHHYHQYLLMGMLYLHLKHW